MRVKYHYTDGREYQAQWPESFDTANLTSATFEGVTFDVAGVQDECLHLRERSST